MGTVDAARGHSNAQRYSKAFNLISWRLFPRPGRWVRFRQATSWQLPFGLRGMPKAFSQRRLTFSAPLNPRSKRVKR
jgi:hypothetical protein